MKHNRRGPQQGRSSYPLKIVSNPLASPWTSLFSKHRGPSPCGAAWLGRTPAYPAAAWMKTALPWRRSQRLSGVRSPLNPVFIWAHWQVLLRVQRKEKTKWKHRALSQHWFKAILWARQEKEGQEKDCHPLVCKTLWWRKERKKKRIMTSLQRVLILCWTIYINIY